MAVTPYKTLGESRSELRTRLGFASAGAAAGVIQSNLNSILAQAQVDLYWTHDWARLRRYEDKELGSGQYLIDYPDSCNPERIRSISINDGSVWGPGLKKGISPEMYTNQANTSRPYRWEPYEQIELFPKADQPYTVRIFFVKNLERYTQDGDHATIDHDLIFTVALGRAKAHYRQPDAQSYLDNANALLARLKGRSWGKDVFNPRDWADEPLAKPRVV